MGCFVDGSFFLHSTQCLEVGDWRGQEMTHSTIFACVGLWFIHGTISLSAGSFWLFFSYVLPHLDMAPLLIHISISVSSALVLR